MRCAIGARGQPGSHDEADLRLELPKVDCRRAEAVARRLHDVAAEERCVEAGLALGTDRSELVAGVAAKLAGHERMLLDREVCLVHLSERRRRRRVLLLREPLPFTPGVNKAGGPRRCCHRHRCKRPRSSCRFEASGCCECCRYCVGCKTSCKHARGRVPRSRHGSREEMFCQDGARGDNVRPRDQSSQPGWDIFACAGVDIFACHRTSDRSTCT